MSRAATVASVIFAISVWGVLIISFLPRQQLPGDFVQFYTLGTSAREGQWSLQYDWPALHALQVSLVPESAAHEYRPSYPPLVAGIFAPVSVLPFRTAYGVWVVTVAVTYLGIMAAASRGCQHLRGVGALAAAVSFPPFVALVVLGQTTIIPLIGFVSGWMFLERQKDLLAGLAFSLVALKPNFGLALAAVLLLTRSWHIVAGVVLGVATLAAATLSIAGLDASVAWWKTALIIVRNPLLIEPGDGLHTHALRTSLEPFLSPGMAFAAWLVVSGVAVALAVRAWRQRPNSALRGAGERPIRTMPVAALLGATIVVSPHVLTYDAVLLAPASLWLIDRALVTRRWPLAAAVVLLAVLFVVPNARLAGVPLVVPIVLLLIDRCGRE